MTTPVTVIITVGSDGEATIAIPHKKQRDANKAASFTDKLSKALGRVVERHIGDHHHHDTEVIEKHVRGTK